MAFSGQRQALGQPATGPGRSPSQNRMCACDRAVCWDELARDAIDRCSRDRACMPVEPNARTAGDTRPEISRAFTETRCSTHGSVSFLVSLTTVQKRSPRLQELANRRESISANGRDPTTWEPGWVNALAGSNPVSFATREASDLRKRRVGRRLGTSEPP